MAEISDITYKKGNFYPFTLTITSKTTGLPIITTGKTFTLMVNAEKAPLVHTGDLFVLTGVNDPDPSSGKVTFSPTAENNSVVGKYYYEILMAEIGSARTIVDDKKWTIYL